MSSEHALYLLEDPDVKRAVQSHYAERAGMVRAALGLLIGVLGGLFLLRFAVGAGSGWATVAWLAVAAGWGAAFAGGSIMWARRLARKANEDQPRYVCVDEDIPVETHRPPPRRGLRWLTW
jgi:protein-S-isoprenylcysteine O-methyltransferase Ste14